MAQIIPLREAAAEAEAATAEYGDQLAKVIQLRPPTEPVPPPVDPPAVPGWAGLLAGVALLEGAARYNVVDPATEWGRLYRFVADNLQAAVDRLRTAHLSPTQARQELTHIRDLQRALHGLQAVLAAVPEPQGVGADAMPSPGAVNAADLAHLRNATARIAVWQRAHHAQVHEQLVDAQGRADAQGVAAASVTADATVATVRAIRGVVSVVIPQAVRELTASIRALRQAQQQANSELARELERRADTLAQRIGDLVRWLRTEALPDLETELEAERAARRQADHDLANGIVTATGPLSKGLSELETAFLPLAAYGLAPLLHQAEKVGRNEQLIDQLGQLDLSSLLAFAGVPALTALVTRLMPPILEAGPRMLGALEGAAATALGEL